MEIDIGLYQIFLTFLSMMRRFDVSMPPIGELTRVGHIQHSFDVFDREFTKRFPGI